MRRDWGRKMKKRSSVVTRIYYTPASLKQWLENTSARVPRAGKGCLSLLSPLKQVTQLPPPPSQPNHLQAPQRLGPII